MRGPNFLFMLGLMLMQVVFSAHSKPEGYCSRRCKNGEFHTLCKFQGPSRYCRTFKNLTTIKSKREILRFHNELRNAFARGEASDHHPPAADMRLIYWDSELEISALRWAQQCTASTERDTCRDLSRFRVGQNIALIMGKKLDEVQGLPVRHLLKQWGDQWGSLVKSTIARYVQNGPEVSELTQALWARTRRLGCADVVYSIAEGKFFRQIVCNYGPAGNSLNRSVYAMGEPCSACPKGSACVFRRLPYLCAGLQ